MRAAVASGIEVLAVWMDPVEIGVAVIGVAVGADIRDTLSRAVAGVRMTDDLGEMSAREAAEDLSAPATI